MRTEFRLPVCRSPRFISRCPQPRPHMADPELDASQNATGFSRSRSLTETPQHCHSRVRRIGASIARSAVSGLTWNDRRRVPGCLLQHPILEP